MDKTLHPAAIEHMPSFITAPGDTDVLMVVAGAILLFAVVAFGVLFLTLHTLPERMAHKSHKLQFEIVAVLGLLALFTHMHIFWVAGLLLALIDIPDVGGWFRRIAGSVEKIADNGARNEPSANRDGAAQSAVGQSTVARADGDAPVNPELAPRTAGGVIHA